MMFNPPIKQAAIAVAGILCCAASSIAGTSATGFAAYYTHVRIENDDPPDRVGEHPDVVVRLNATRSLVFARDSSFLPCFVNDGKRTYLDELVPRKGDGDARRPDRINRYSYVRILENTPQQVVVHWRYMADFSRVGWDGVVHEYFTIRPDGGVRRIVRQGTPDKSAWDDPGNRHVQTFRLTENGVTDLHHTAPRRSPEKAAPVRGRDVRQRFADGALLGYRFDDALEAAGPRALEAVSAKHREIEGSAAVWREGVSGTCLLFDGYTSGVTDPGFSAGSTPAQLTVQAWVAPGAYPFNWAPIVQQSEWGKSGYYLGVNAYGQLGFMAWIGKEWVQVRASTGTFETDLPLFRWHHVAATYDGHDVRLYLDGREIASKHATGEIRIPEHPLSIGLNREKFKPTSPVREWATYPSIFGIDGLIDEVVVYDRALDPREIAASFSSAKLSDEAANTPDLEARRMPAFPNGKPAARFGAKYCNLSYHAGFDNLWRVGDDPDILVEFDQSPCRVVFWKGLRFAPALVTENGKWSGDQSAECGGIWDKELPFDHPEAVGCAEHMSDAQARHSHVRIIENTPARTVVHWRYAEIDVRYKFPSTKDGWGPWADEYYTIYPDATCIRHVARGEGGWQETLFYNAPGTKPEDNVNLDAYTLVNARGDSRTYSWAAAPEPYPAIPGDLDLLDSPFISMVRFKSAWRPFYIYQKGSVRAFATEVRPEFSRFPWWNHYPVSQAISDGRQAERADRMTHSSLVWGKPYGDCLMTGLTDREPVELLPLAISWGRPPALGILSGAVSHGYRPQRRDYPMTATASVIRMRLDASKESPAVNPCFTVRNWGGAENAVTEVEGLQKFPVRQGTFVDTDGTRTLVVFLGLKTQSPIQLTIRQ